MLRWKAMMLSKLTFVTTFALLALCISARVDSLKKCAHDDDNCSIIFLKQILQDVAENGIDELNVQPIDPLYVKDLNIPIPGFLNVNVEDGKVAGIKDCSVDKHHNEFDKGITKAEFTCDLTIRGKIQFQDVSEFVRNLFGQDSDNGNGEVELMIEKIKMKLNTAYDIIKKDEDIFFKYHLDKFQFEYDVGDFRIKVDQMIFGTHDISELVENFFNQNWKTLMPTLIKSILDLGMKLCMELLTEFFEKVPANYYYTDDISKFVKN